MEKKKMKLGVKILIVVLILLFLFLLTTFRKFLILKQIALKGEEDSESTNFYSKTYTLKGEITEHWIYGKINILENTLIENGEILTRKIYTDENKQEAWIFIEGKEQKTAVQLEYNDLITIPAGINFGLPSSKDIKNLIQMAIITNIKNDKWNDKDAYVVSFNFIDEDKNKVWIDKENYRMVGQKNGNSIDDEGNILDNISSYICKYDSLTIDDVRMPDLTEYTVKNSNDNK